ncbi:peptidylprolyl isomerase [Sulfurifustis variabilis]|uniref:peptidylprolyl isomerase n=1 Tax=Sulfurifustis variabilis TaxID=1675686 RepID=A0A1B4VC30_9GAMM|nr:peptidylprolyl isomerase [Sulfurifustis variabilis]BAU50424.1 peptidylprolyl isomerase [Sulfurifustis variabilis]
MNAVVEKHKVVSITYRIRDQGGEIVEINDLPVEYVHGGASDLFPKIEQALEGREVGDSVTVRLAPEEAFGGHDPKQTFTDDIENAPPELRQVGAQFEAQNAKGETINLVVTDVGDGRITVDANHPLAGKTIAFEVTVREIRDATEEERVSGRPAQGRSLLQ